MDGICPATSYNISFSLSDSTAIPKPSNAIQGCNNIQTQARACVKLTGLNGYVQFEYIQDELKDLFALADVVISRAGANAICELLALRKPNLLIPLSANASRGDQILNARSFEHQGFSMVMEEEELTDEKLLAAVHKLYDSREDFINAMNQSSQQDPIKTIIGLIEDAASK